jgi:hypothetical protein
VFGDDVGNLAGWSFQASSPVGRGGAVRALTRCEVKATLTLQYDLPCVEEPGTPERESDDVVEIFLEFSRVNLIVSV